MKEKLLLEFGKIFGDSQECQVFFAPGRVNLIGDHTDYNGGHAFPCALTIGTYGVARKRMDRKLCFYSANFENIGIIETEVDSLTVANDWTDYPKGVVWAFEKKGMPVPCGLDLYLYGNIPNGSGLSSSASVEVLMGFILKELFEFEVSNLSLAQIGQMAENEFNGMNCGIMDQFAIAMGEKEHAIFLDTDSLSYDYVPLEMDGCKLVISCSNKKRGLVDSKYNERRQECEQALLALQKVTDIKTLGELDMETFEQYNQALENMVQRKRARHAVSENQRTILAREALKHNDLEKFGALMNESHKSLREDYEVTGIELDTLVETAWDCPGVIGSRMTGAGFGGCTVSLVREDCVDKFIQTVGYRYKEKIGYAADFYIVSAGAGPQIL